MKAIAYCLMPDHFHFMLQPQRHNNLSKFVGLLDQSYAQAINLRYHRKRNLFHNERFQHSHAHSERYQILLCRYIHVNPLKDGIVENLRDWPFSNYLEFIEARKGELFAPEFREKFFKTAEEYEEFVEQHGMLEEDTPEKFFV